MPRVYDKCVCVCVWLCYEILDDESPQRWAMLKNEICCNSSLFSILILIEIIATANAISSDQAFVVQHLGKIITKQVSQIN